MSENYFHGFVDMHHVGVQKDWMIAGSGLSADKLAVAKELQPEEGVGQGFILVARALTKKAEADLTRFMIKCADGVVEKRWENYTGAVDEILARNGLEYRRFLPEEKLIIVEGGKHSDPRKGLEKLKLIKEAYSRA